MSSNLAELENSGILRMIDRLSIMEKNSGVINHEDYIPPVSFVGSLIEYARGAYDDEYGKNILANRIDGSGITVLSATRNENIGMFTVELVAPFESKTVTIRIPHGAYK